MKDLAMLCFRETRTVPSSEAVHAALLLANVAWNRALGRDVPDCEELLMVYTRSEPKLWSEQRSGNTETLIQTMIQAKEKLYPTDRRVILICGMREGHVRVEWCDEKDYPQAEELAKMRIAALAQQYGGILQRGKKVKKKP
ncbi:MAG: hypothetical protein IPN53_00750 [Comamonadaceae bacterium]|nr:hypothetical protein [Comamonadaceae bacterium]